MARNRMFKPSFFRDEKTGQLSFMEQVLFLGLLSFADDNGVGRANPMLIKADIFPYKSLRESDMQKALDKFAKLRLILLYTIDGQKYYFVRNFKKHQVINKPTPSSLPMPPEEVLEGVSEYYGSTTVGLPEDYRPKKRKEKEIKEKEKIKEDEIKVIIKLPIIDNVLGLSISEGSIKEWQSLYPSVNVDQELRSMRGWLLADSNRQQTEIETIKFINRWLNREQKKIQDTPALSTKQLHKIADIQSEKNDNYFTDLENTFESQWLG